MFLVGSASTAGSRSRSSRSRTQSTELICLTSKSRILACLPWAAASRAISWHSVDLPTPPFCDTTPMTCRFAIAAILPVETPLREERVYRRVAAAKVAVEHHRVRGVAGAVDRLQPRGKALVEDVAGFGEGREPVGVEHLRPHISVIAGGVAGAVEQMLEMRRAVAQSDLRRHADPGEEVALELGDVERLVVGARVELE